MNDDEFIQRIAEQLDELLIAYDLTANQNPVTGQHEIIAHRSGGALTIGRFDDGFGDMATWLVTSIINVPRLLQIVRDLREECEDLEREKDNLIGEFLGANQ